MDFDKVASEFPGTQDKAFLDAACVSIAPRLACEAVADFSEIALLCPAESSTQHHLKMDEMRQEAVVESARLLKTERENIALVESTTHGLNIVASCLPLPADSRVLVSEMEFLQVAIPWVLQKERGVEVVSVPHSEGRVLPEDFEPYITPETKLLVISSTQWNNGFRCNLRAFADLCRRHDMFLAVDAVQQLGAIRIEPEQEGVDFLAAGGHKWLNAPFGCGILYVSPRALTQMKPVYWGYLNLNEPEGGWGAYFSTPDIVSVRAPEAYQFTDTAKKLEIGGTSNYPGAIGLAASMRLANDLGMGRIERHVLELTDMLIEGLLEVGATLVTVPDRQYRSGIVSFRFYEDLESERELVARLCRERVFVSIRFTASVGGIRVSCHYYNTRDHLEALFEALRQAAQERTPDYAQEGS